MSALPDQLPIVPPPPAPKTIADAVRQIHDANQTMAQSLRRLERLVAVERQTPELHQVTINPANNGVYQVVDRANGWMAKSIGILNTNATVPVFVGIGGHSAQPTSGSPQCSPGSALVLPVECFDLELGCDPAVLLADAATVFVIRYQTVQPLLAGAL